MYQYSVKMFAARTNFFGRKQKIVTGQPGKSGHLHNQEICVLSKSIHIIMVVLYSNMVFKLHVYVRLYLRRGTLKSMAVGVLKVEGVLKVLAHEQPFVAPFATCPK